MHHHFNVDVATRYGVNSAILLDNLYYWIEKNRANENNYYDGYYWTYNSKKALAELFPYLSEKQVRTAIDILVNDGILLTGNYNKLKLDKTLWYTITKKGYELLGDCRIGLFDLPSRANANDSEGKSFDLEGKAIPNSKNTDNKPNTIVMPEEPASSEITPGSHVLAEENKREEKVGAVPAAKPRRDYTVKPTPVSDAPKRPTKPERRQVRIKEMLDTIPSEYQAELGPVLGEYLNMRLDLAGAQKIDIEWFEKEWRELINPALQKYDVQDVVTAIRTITIPRQYKRCFISVYNTGSTPRQSFNDTKKYTEQELSEFEQMSQKEMEEDMKNGTFRREF